MFPITDAIARVLPQVPPPVMILALLAASLLLIFAGSSLAKLVVFLAVGLVAAAMGGTLAAQYLSHQWAIVGFLLGFLVGGLLGVALLSLGIGLVVGYMGYLGALDLVGSSLALIVGAAFFVVGLILSSKILSVATAFAGGLLLFNILDYLGLGQPLSMLVAGALTLVGLWVQLAPKWRVARQAAPGLGATRISKNTEPDV